jgi:FxLD family lantipeptide
MAMFRTNDPSEKEGKPMSTTLDMTDTDDVFALDIRIVTDANVSDAGRACDTSDGCAATCASSCVSNS